MRLEVVLIIRFIDGELERKNEHENLYLKNEPRYPYTIYTLRRIVKWVKRANQKSEEIFKDYNYIKKLEKSYRRSGQSGTNIHVGKLVQEGLDL